MAASKALRFGQHIKELRIHLCQKSPSSQGVRDFIEQHYVGLKQNNPKFPILIRECSGVQAKLWARYDYGKENNMPLNNSSSQEVLEAIKTVSTAPV